MPASTLQGTVSHYQQTTETSGFINQGQGQISTAQVLVFRVNNKPVSFKSSGGGSIGNGDQVTVIGSDKAGTFQATCMRNDSTGAVFYALVTPQYVGGVAGLLLGIPLSFALIGIPIVLLAAYLIYWGRNNANANKMLDATRAMGAIPAHAT
ncbi:MAG TPA: hypothetical protein VKB33_09330 [Nitrospira sp.]|nr:hypothetical protein [Nitrospira sp.]